MGSGTGSLFISLVVTFYHDEDVQDKDDGFNDDEEKKIGTGPLFIQIVAAFDHDEDGVGGVYDCYGCSV